MEHIHAAIYQILVIHSTLHQRAGAISPICCAIGLRCKCWWNRYQWISVDSGLPDDPHHVPPPAPLHHQLLKSPWKCSTDPTSGTKCKRCVGFVGQPGTSRQVKVSSVHTRQVAGTLTWSQMSFTYKTRSKVLDSEPVVDRVVYVHQ